MLRDALMDEPESDEDQYAAERMREMHELIELTTRWVDDVQHLPQNTAVQLMKLGGNVTKLLTPASARKAKAN
jgi:DNA-binding transcriptional regulator GbsR (MarR family)